MSKSNLASNLRLKSNVYPCPSDVIKEFRAMRLNGQPLSEETLPYIKQIRGQKALLQFDRAIHGVCSNDDSYKARLIKIGFEEWQIQLYWEVATNCAFAEEGQHPIGLIAPEKVGIKCRNEKCRFFDTKIKNCGT